MRGPQPSSSQTEEDDGKGRDPLGRPRALRNLTHHATVSAVNEAFAQLSVERGAQGYGEEEDDEEGERGAVHDNDTQGEEWRPQWNTWWEETPFKDLRQMLAPFRDKGSIRSALVGWVSSGGFVFPVGWAQADFVGLVGCGGRSRTWWCAARRRRRRPSTSCATSGAPC